MKIRTFIAVVALTAGLSAVSPATAATAPTATAQVDCDGEALNVSLSNPTTKIVAWDISIDVDGDGVSDDGDGGQTAAGSDQMWGFMLRGNGVYHVAVSADGTVVLDEQVHVDCWWPEYLLTAYDGTIWRVDADGFRAISYDEWRIAGFPFPTPAPTDYVKYPWSSTISAVTFFGQPEDEWVWKHISYEEWSRAGRPAPRDAGWIQGSTYYQWSTGPQVFVQDVAGVRHALTYEEWRASGFRSYDRRQNQGFVKLSWDGSIAFLNDVAAGQGGPVTYGEWASQGFPQPQVAPRFPGDQIYRNYGSSTIWYAGPTVNRPITFAEWSVMGRPNPSVRGTPQFPSRDKDCADYPSRAAAQAEFDWYFPAYGDVFGLDGDGDGVACESFFG